MKLLEKITRHLQQLAPHQFERENALLLLAAKDEIEAWEKAADALDCETPAELLSKIHSLGLENAEKFYILRSDCK
jgi:hypothetical protein